MPVPPRSSPQSGGPSAPASGAAGPRRSRRGATLVVVAVSATALFGIATGVLELGRLHLYVAQAQRAADAAALAGASGFPSEDSVRARAAQFAAANTIAGAAATITRLTLDPATQAVRVRVASPTARLAFWPAGVVVERLAGARRDGGTVRLVE